MRRGGEEEWWVVLIWRGRRLSRDEIKKSESGH